MKLFFSVGEPSGDLHGANLIRQLRTLAPECQCVGYGGPRMQAAGCTLHYDLTQLAVMWLLRVVLNLHRFVALLIQADRYFRDQRPDAVILIDYPGFNWWIARRAKARGIPLQAFPTSAYNALRNDLKVWNIPENGEYDIWRVDLGRKNPIFNEE